MHTPGPYCINTGSDYPIQILHNGEIIADVFGESRQVRQSNACLFAAAPDLLEQLYKITNLLVFIQSTFRLYPGIEHLMIDALTGILITIDKAQGKQS